MLIYSNWHRNSPVSCFRLHSHSHLNISLILGDYSWSFIWISGVMNATVVHFTVLNPLWFPLHHLFHSILFSFYGIPCCRFSMPSFLKSSALLSVKKYLWMPFMSVQCFYGIYFLNFFIGGSVPIVLWMTSSMQVASFSSVLLQNMK